MRSLGLLLLLATLWAAASSLAYYDPSTNSRYYYTLACPDTQGPAWFWESLSFSSFEKFTPWTASADLSCWPPDTNPSQNVPNGMWIKNTETNCPFDQDGQVICESPGYADNGDRMAWQYNAPNNTEITSILYNLRMNTRVPGNYGGKYQWLPSVETMNANLDQHVVQGCVNYDTHHCTQDGGGVVCDTEESCTNLSNEEGTEYPQGYNPIGRIAGPIKTVNLKLVCRPNNDDAKSPAYYAATHSTCPRPDSGSPSYQPHISVFNMVVELKVQNPPQITGQDAATTICAEAGLGNNCFLRGELPSSISAISGAGIAAVRLEVLANGSPVLAETADLRDSNCDWTGVDEFYFSAPGCNSSVSGQSLNLSTVSLAAGPSYSMKLSAYDPSGWGAEADAPGTFRVDNTDPQNGGVGDTPACDVTIRNPNNNLGPTEWIKGSITVGGAACDAQAGIHSSRIELSVNGGPFTSDHAALKNCQGAGTPNCQVDTTVFPEGTRLNFRTWAQDNSRDGNGNPGNRIVSSVTADRYVDNTPPHVQGELSIAKFTTICPSPPGTDPALSQANRWTNDPVVVACWTAFSKGPGSEVTDVYYRYHDGCALGPETKVGTNAVTKLELNNRDEDCQQGKHQLYVYAEDAEGNKGSITVARLTDTYNFDSRVPRAPRNLLADPAGWSAVNNFGVSWVNDAWDNITVSPLVRTHYRINGGNPDSVTTCLGSQQECSIQGLSVPNAGGSYPIQIWSEDEAGNLSLEHAASTDFNFNDEFCKRNSPG